MNDQQTTVIFLGYCRKCDEPMSSDGSLTGFKTDEDGSAIRHEWCAGTWQRADPAAVPWLAPAAPAVPPDLPASASPIETRFWNTYRQLRLPALAGLVPEHRAHGFRIDFALPGRKIGIELDGFATHSSTADIAKDRRRQRVLEGHGWYIIRFGGSEVHHDAEGCVRQAAYLIEHARKGGPA